MEATRLSTKRGNMVNLKMEPTPPATLAMMAKSIQMQSEHLPVGLESSPLEQAAKALGLVLCVFCEIQAGDFYLAPGAEEGPHRVAAVDTFHGHGGSTTCLSGPLCPDCADDTAGSSDCGHRNCCYGCDCPDDCECGCGDGHLCGKDCYLCDGSGEHDIRR